MPFCVSITILIERNEFCMSEVLSKEIIDKKIRESNKAIVRLRGMIPFWTIVMVLFSFGYPLIPGRRSTESLAQMLGYPLAVSACLLVSGLVYYIGYNKAVKRRKDEIVELEKLRDSSLNEV
jgi:hypothetical protein